MELDVKYDLYGIIIFYFRLVINCRCMRLLRNIDVWNFGDLRILILSDREIGVVKNMW